MSILDLFKRKPKEPYLPLEVAETKKGDYNVFYKKLLDKSLILLIVGKRGSGKTAFGMKLMEMFSRQTKKKCHVLGFEQAKVPWWMKKVDDIEDIPQQCRCPAG